ncbi:hypothetical protein Pcinc_031468 [Petrolisthes cinctipes]|uniref:Amino acid transporter transmembrane domain-containing protein n=1 Tax=Petrolisthes cinctipes TaxID=88211 RepID=A0AAE1EWB1_PETCI|nr:hypothetical protein Pcinc_031468 [Petrolisthes cinctipes]
MADKSEKTYLLPAVWKPGKTSPGDTTTTTTTAIIYGGTNVGSEGEDGLVCSGQHGRAQSGLSVLLASFFLVAQVSGLGVLALPWAVAQTGWAGLGVVVASGVLVGVAAVHLGTSWIILEERWPQYQRACRKPYPAMALRSLGVVGWHIANVVQGVTLFGVSTVTILLSAQLLESILTTTLPQFGFGSYPHVNQPPVRYQPLPETTWNTTNPNPRTSTPITLHNPQQPTHNPQQPTHNQYSQPPPHNHYPNNHTQPTTSYPQQATHNQYSQPPPQPLPSITLHNSQQPTHNHYSTPTTSTHNPHNHYSQSPQSLLTNLTTSTHNPPQPLLTTHHSHYSQPPQPVLTTPTITAHPNHHPNYHPQPHPFNTATVAACVVVVVKILVEEVPPGKEAQHPAPTLYSFFLGFGTMLFSYGGAITFPTIQNDMRDRSKFPLAVVISFVALLVMYLPLAALGYQAFWVCCTSEHPAECVWTCGDNCTSPYVG